MTSDDACTCPQGTGSDWSFTTIVCDSPDTFAPAIHHAETPDESSGYGWFTRDEISDLNLHPGFARAWESVLDSRDNKTIKCSVRRVDLDGQVIWEHPDPCPCTDPPAAGGGGPEFMSHDVNGIQDGRAGGSRGGGTAGMYDDPGLLSRPHGAAMPSETAGPSIGYVRDVPPAKAPIPQGYQGGHWPEGGHGTGQSPVSPIGGQNSVSPQVKPPKNRKRSNKGVLEAVTRPAGPQVMAQMEENFPSQALEWVPQAVWSGPNLVSLNLVDFHDMETWSAFRETARVKHFERLIAGNEKFNPVILIKVPGHKKYRVVDGHHRALAYKNLGRPVKAWIGIVPFGLVHVAEETHSSQLHQGSSSQNG